MFRGTSLDEATVSRDVHPYFDRPLPHLFAHQGASGDAPTNTMPAFQRAVELGIPYLETDCHATRDGEIVLCHDETVDRTTDGSGRIRDHSFSELSALDAGWSFTPDGQRFPYRGRGVRIPRLAELLERYPRAHVNLEIKRGDLEVVCEVVRLIRREHATERVLLAAGDDRVMALIRELDPGTAIGASLGDLTAFYEAVREARVDSYQPRGHALQIPTEFAGNPLVTPDSLAAAHSHGLFVHVWTINDPAEMRRLLLAGVDGVMSDYPAALLEVARSL